MKLLALIILFLADGIWYAGAQMPPVPQPVVHRAKVKPVSLVLKPMTTTVARNTNVTFYAVITEPFHIQASSDLASGQWTPLRDVVIQATPFQVPNNGRVLYLRGYFSTNTTTVIFTNSTIKTVTNK